MLSDPASFAIQLLNGLQYAMLLFLLSVGLSVVFGLINFINLAHGTLYMLSAFIGLTVARVTGSFWAALVVAPLIAAVIGSIFYAALLRRLQGEGAMKQVLVTFGLIFIGIDVVRMIWGDYEEASAPPALFAASVRIWGHLYPSYRLFVIALGLVVAVALWLGLERTRLGAVVRAGVDDRVMAANPRIKIDAPLFRGFCLRCWLAGLCGGVGLAVLQIHSRVGV